MKKYLSALLISNLLISFSLFAHANNEFDVLLNAYKAGGAQSPSLPANAYAGENFGQSPAGLNLTIDGSNHKIVGSTVIVDPANSASTIPFTATGFNLYFSRLALSNVEINSFIGAVYVDKNSYLQTSNVVFSTNSDSNGKAGAIYNLGEAVINGDTQFIGNGDIEGATSAGEGGIYNAGKLKLDTNSGDIIFLGNKAHISYEDPNNPWGGASLIAYDRDIYNAGKGIIEMTGTNSININGSIMGNGRIVKDDGTLILNGAGADFSGFFTQTGGTTIVNDGVETKGSFFGGTNFILGGELIINNTGLAYRVNLGANAVLKNYEKDAVNALNVYSGYINFTQSGAQAEFNKDASQSQRIKYNLINDLNSGQQNTVIFKDAVLYLGSSQYLGQTDYIFNNALVDLLNDSNYLRRVEFNSLIANNAYLNFNVIFRTSADRKKFITALSDMFSVKVGAANFNVGLIKISGDRGLEINPYTLQSSTLTVLGGTAKFESSDIGDTFYSATTENLYSFEVLDSSRIHFNVVGKSSASTLYFLNNVSKSRVFNFSYYEGAPVIWKIDRNLGDTRSGIFAVFGHDSDASHSVLSGEKKHSFFKIDLFSVELILKNITIKNAFSNSSGSALYINNSLSTMTLNNLIFDSNVSSGSGGAMFIKGNKLTVFNLFFYSNKSAHTGGGLALINSSLTFLSNAIFEKNEASSDGGAIYAKDSELKFLNYSTISFVSNISSGSGGAVYLTNSQAYFENLYVNNYFKNNRAALFGGVFFAQNSYFSFLENLHETSSFVFANNAAGASGGVFYLFESSAVLKNSKGFYFEKNTAKSSGAAVYLKNALLDINAGQAELAWTENKADHSGGAFFLEQSTAIFNGLGFWTGNKSLKGHGGAIYAVSNSYILFASALKTAFSSNSALSGGSLYLKESTAVFVGEVSFELGAALQNGAFVYLEDAFLYFEASVNANYGNAKSSGGAFFVRQATIAFNSDINIRYSTSGAAGGAFYLNNSDLNFNGNASIEFSFSSGIGGGFYIENSRLFFTGRDKSIGIRDSMALGSGGGMFVKDSTLFFSSVSASFERNVSSRGAGGAIYLDNSYLAFDLTEGVGDKDVRFNDNMSYSSGGAVFARNSTLIFSSVSVGFERNISTRAAGGAMYLDNSIALFTMANREAYFNANRARGDGGALYLKDSYVLFASSLARAYFNDNESLRGSGGFAYIDAGSTMTIARAGNTDINNNIARGSGGAIFNAGTLNLDISSGNISFSGNRVSTNSIGNDIYNAAGAKINIKGSSTTFSMSFRSGIVGSGTINQDSLGTVNFEGGNNSDFKGIYNQSAGTTVIRGNFLKNNGANNFIRGGTLILEGGSEISTYTNTQSGVEKTVFNMGAGTILRINSDKTFVEGQIIGIAGTVGDIEVIGGNIYFNGDFSNADGFNRNFTQTAATVNMSSNIFSGTIKISGGSRFVLSEHSIGAGWTEIMLGRKDNNEATLVLNTAAGQDFIFSNTSNRIVGFDDVNSTITYGGVIEKNGEGHFKLQVSNVDLTSFSYTQNGNGTTTISVDGTKFFGGYNRINGGWLVIEDNVFFVHTSTIEINAQIIIGGSDRPLNLGTIRGGGTIYKNIGGTLFINDSNSNNSYFNGSINNISGAVISTGMAYNYNARLSTNTTLHHYNTSGNNSTVRIEFLGTGSSAVFAKADGGILGRANYELNNRMESATGGLNFIFFENSNVKFGGERNFIGSTTYIFDNSILDLTINNNQSVRTITFNSMEISNSSITIGITFDDRGLLQTDQLFYSGQGQQQQVLGLESLRIYDSGRRVSAGAKVVLGGALRFAENISLVWATNENKYDIVASGFEIAVFNIQRASAETLGLINRNRGPKGFNFSNSQVYAIAESLGETGEGVFTVSGLNGNAWESILSGSSSHSFFRLINDFTHLTVSNLSVIRAFSISSGAVAFINNNQSTAIFRNVIITSNTSYAGGAFYSESGGTLNMSDMIISKNIALSSGGAVYLKESNSEFSGRMDFSSNAVRSDGGALFTSESAVTFKGGSGVYFTSNTALGLGGAIAAFASAFVFEGQVYFSTNTANSNGGAVYGRNSSFDFRSNAYFTENKSFTGSGASLYMEYSSANFNGEFIISSARARGNGAALYAANSFIYVNGRANFLWNISGGSGTVYIVDASSGVIFNSDVDFTLNKVSGSGGAVYSVNTYLQFMRGTVFTSNSANISGGAISINRGTIVFNSDARFTENHAKTGFGGAISIVQSSADFMGNVWFSSNNAALSGGAFYSSASFVYFKNQANFEMAWALNGSGGGINAVHNSSIVFGGDVRGTSVSARGDGGLINLDSSYAELGIDRYIRSLGGYAAGSGGAINIINSTFAFYGNVELETNTAKFMGGAVNVQNSFLYFSTYTTNLVFKWNVAHSSGGALSLDKSQAVFDTLDRTVNISFEGNISSAIGGAIYAHETDILFTSRTKAAFKDNQASSGAALALVKSRFVFEGDAAFEDNISSGVYSFILLDASTIVFSGENTTFKASTYSYASSIVSAISPSSMSIMGKNVAFENFRSSTNGNVLGSLSGANLSVYISSWVNVTASGNIALSSGGFMAYYENQVFYSNLVLNSNSAAIGGGIYVENAKLFFLGEKAEFTGNISTAENSKGGAIALGANADVDFSSMSLSASANEAAYGGFMYLQNKSWVFHKDISMSANRARKDGGAFYVEGTTLTFDSASLSFDANVSSGSGGAIYSKNSLYISNTEKQDSFANNIADKQGGAIYSLASSWSFNSEQTVVSGNSAGKDGGAIFAGNASYFKFNFLQSYFSENKAFGGSGGAVYSSASHVDFENNFRTVFYANYASDFGGAIYANNSTITFLTPVTTYFQANISSNSGGGIYATNNSIVNLRNPVFYGNYSRNAGGAAFVDNGAVLNIYVDDNMAADIRGNVVDYVYLIDRVYTSIYNGLHIGDRGTVNIHLLGMNSAIDIIDTISSAGDNALNIYGKGNFNLYMAADVSSITVKDEVKFNMAQGAMLQAKTLIVESSTVFIMDYSARILAGDDKFLFAVKDDAVLRMAYGSAIYGKVEIAERASLDLKNNGIDYVFIDDLLLNGTLYMDAFSDSSIDRIGANKITFGNNAKISINNVDLAGKKYRRQYYVILSAPTSISSVEIEFNGMTLDDGASTAISFADSSIFNANSMSAINPLYNSQALARDLAPASSQYYDSYHVIYNSSIVEDEGSLTVVFDGDPSLLQTHFSAENMSFNQRSVSDILNALSTMLGPSKLDYFINQMDYMDTGSIKDALTQIAPYFMANIFLSQTIDNSRNDVFSRIQKPAEYDGEIESWGRAMGSLIDLGSDDNSPGHFRNIVGGMIFGLEKYYGSSDMILGAVGRYNTNTLVQEQNSASVNLYSLGFYGGIFRNETDVKMMIGGGINDNDIHRAIPFMGVTANSKFYSYQGFLDIETGRSFDYWLEDYIFRPFVGAYVNTLSIPNVMEKDAGVLSIRYKEITFVRSAVRTGLGLYGGEYDGLFWNFTGSVDYVFMGTNAELDGKFQQDSEMSFKFRSVDIGRFLFGLNANINYVFTDKISLYFGLTYTAATRYESYSGSAGIRYFLD